MNDDNEIKDDLSKNYKNDDKSIEIAIRNLENSLKEIKNFEFNFDEIINGTDFKIITEEFDFYKIKNIFIEIIYLSKNINKNALITSKINDIYLLIELINLMIHTLNSPKKFLMNIVTECF